jgi:hypothetical protein
MGASFFPAGHKKWITLSANKKTGAPPKKNTTGIRFLLLTSATWQTQRFAAANLQKPLIANRH